MLIYSYYTNVYVVVAIAACLEDTQFDCGDTNSTRRCIKAQWRCDGDTDCPNNADERGCGKLFNDTIRRTHCE